MKLVKSRRKSRLGAAGFTLLEALLALFIFATAVISLVEAINETGQTVLLARRERQVQARLETLLLEATRSPALLSMIPGIAPEESTTHDEGVAYITRRVAVEVRNKDGQKLSDIMLVSVTARWKEGREEQTVTAETWVYPRLFLPAFQEAQP